MIQPHECHRLQGRPILGTGNEDACRCFLTGGGFLECPQPQPVNSLPTTYAPVKPALTGDLCSTCGGPNMTRAGTCMVCRDCGSTSGGCS